MPETFLSGAAFFDGQLVLRRTMETAAAGKPMHCKWCRNELNVVTVLVLDFASPAFMPDINGTDRLMFRALGVNSFAATVICDNCGAVEQEGSEGPPQQHGPKMEPRPDDIVYTKDGERVRDARDRPPVDAERWLQMGTPDDVEVDPDAAHQTMEQALHDAIRDLAEKEGVWWPDDEIDPDADNPFAGDPERGQPPRSPQ